MGGNSRLPAPPRPSDVPKEKPRQHFAPAERNRVKRTGVVGGISQKPAPTHPLYMPRAIRHVSTLAPLSAPKLNALGRWLGTHGLLLQRIRCACQGRDVSNLTPLSTTIPVSHLKGCQLTPSCSPQNVKYAKASPRQHFVPLSQSNARTLSERGWWELT
jgi:hypothetical protein